MRIVVAKCSVVYTGRGDTKMNPAVRAIFIKEDGAISIHNDAGNKPLNYMGKGNVFTESYEDDVLVWQFDTRKENLTIHMHTVVSDSDHVLDLDDEGLIRDGTESHLQEWLADNLSVLGGDYTLIGREFATGAGAVDLLVQDAVTGQYVCVEIKRIAMLGAVGQVNRYVNALRETEEYENIRGMIAALDIRPNTLKLAEKRGVECVTVDNTLWTNRKTDVSGITAIEPADAKDQDVDE